MGQRLKKKDSPASLAFLPTSVELLKKQINECGSPVKTHFHTLVGCSTNGKDQLAILKQIGSVLKENGGLHKRDDIYILSSMFIHCISRHPMRRNLSSMFENINEEFKWLFLSTVSEMLEAILKFDENSSYIDIRENIDLIASLMENFPTGDKAIKENNRKVFLYMNEALQLFFSSARNEGSPLVQTKLMQHMLTTLKTIIAVLQKCEKFLWEEITNEANMGHREEYLSCINNLTKNSLEIIYHEYVILECRSAAAMIFPAIFTHLPDDYITLFVNMIYNGYRGNLSSYDTHTATSGISKILFDSLINFFHLKPHLSAMLVLLHGLLVKLPDRILHWTMATVTMASTTLFQDLFIDDLIEITLKSSVKNVLVLAFRTITLWIEKARCISTASIQNNSLIKLTTDKVLPHLFPYVDHHIDTIRHNVNTAIKDCFLLLAAVNNHELIDKCSREYFNGSLNSRGRISMLINTCQFVSIQTMLNTQQELPSKIIELLGDVDLASHACDLYNILCEKHLHEILERKIGVKLWIETWINNLYTKLSDDNQDLKGNIVNFVIPSLLKMRSNIVVDILSDMQVNPSGEKVRAVIVFLKCLRGMKNFVNDTGISFDSLAYKIHDGNGDISNNGDMWKNMIGIGDMKNCLTHIDDQVRLDTLSLICSSVKTTDPIDNEDIKLLQYFLQFNMGSENPSFRHQLITNLKKVCWRMFNHAFQLAKQSNLLSDNESVKNYAILNMYGDFLVSLTQFTFKYLYLSAPYSQISTSLEITSLLTNIFYENMESSLLKYYIFDEKEKIRFTNILIDCFNDSYDPNRAIVIDIFKKDPIFCSLSDINVHKLFDEALVNLNSPKPDISSVAAYYMVFLALVLKDKDLPKLYNGFLDENGFYFTEISVKLNNPTLALLDIHMILLQRQLKIMKANLITGCHEAPLYGVLYSVRLLFQLQKYDFNSSMYISENNISVSENRFSMFLNHLIEISLDVINIVSPYVSNDAPEGYLCDVSLTEIFEILHLDDSKDRNIELEAQLARMLLVSCWRSMKEVSLLIGIIVSSFSNLTDQSSKQNLPSSSITKIWNMFCDILLRSKHAGAYELASLGFIKLCSVLWSSYDEVLRLIPANAVISLVNDLLEPIPFDKAQVTRRSAGLPFYLEALCITEPPIKDKQSFKSLMKLLTDLCRNKMLQHDVNKLVISLNILRAFYKNAKLREDVFPYVTDGVIIAIQGFGSSKWAVRNSCTLLFSALMQRIFGVKKCKMTGREFFSRFPLLYSFLLDQAKCINDSLGSDGKGTSVYGTYHPSLFPVLLLLSHLYPSTIDGTNSLMRLEEFVPYVMRCGMNAVYKTRTMAAKALVPLISVEKIENILLQIICGIQSSFSQNGNPIDQNHVHGSLLQLKFILERCFNLPTNILTLSTVFERYISISCYCLNSRITFVVNSLYVEILTLFIQKGFSDTSYVALPLTLHHLLSSTTQKTNFISLLGYPLFLRSAAKYIQTLIKYTKEINVLEDVLIRHINRSWTEENVVDMFDMVMLFMKSKYFDVLDEILELIQDVVDNYQIPKKVGDMLLNFIKDTSVKDKCFPKALSTYGLIMKMENEQYDPMIIQVFRKIFDEASGQFSDELRRSVVKFSVNFIVKLDKCEEGKIIEDIYPILEEIWKFLDESSRADRCETSREETTFITCLHPQHSTILAAGKSVVYRYFNCCINLLKDSSLRIRDLAAQKISSGLRQTTCSGDRFYVPQPSAVIESFFRGHIFQQLRQHHIECTAYLFALMLDIDFFQLNDWLNRNGTSSTQPTKSFGEVSDNKQPNTQPTQSFREILDEKQFNTQSTKSPEEVSYEKQPSTQPTQSFIDISDEKQSNTQSTKSLEEVSDEKDLLKRFVVYEESKENPYYDVTDICERVYQVLHEYYGSSSSAQLESISVLVGATKSYCNGNISRNLGWKYVNKFVMEFIEVSI